MSYRVDTAAARQLADSLRGGRQSLEDTAASCPGVPDGGELSVEMGRLLSLFSGAAGELSRGVAVAADAVDECARVYDETDASVGQRIRRVHS